MTDYWTTCPVTIMAMTFIDDHMISSMLDEKSEWEGVRTKYTMGRHNVRPEMLRLWEPITELVFHAWAHRRFIADIGFSTPSGEIHRYADQDFSGMDNLPDSIMTTLLEAPLTRYIDHPVFVGSHFTEQSSKGIPRGPACDIPVDHSLPRTIDLRRAWLLKRYPDQQGRRP